MSRGGSDRAQFDGQTFLAIALEVQRSFRNPSDRIAMRLMELGGLLQELRSIEVSGRVASERTDFDPAGNIREKLYQIRSTLDGLSKP